MRNTQRFLLYSGLFLLSLVILGYIGLGPTASASALGAHLYFDPAENLLHLIFGLLALVGAKLLKSDRSLRILSGLLGAVALIAVVVGILNYQMPAPNLGLLNMEWLDDVIHAILALWGFWVAFMPEGPFLIKDEKPQLSHS